MQIINEIKDIEKSFESIKKSNSLNNLDELKIKYLGRKGIISNLYKKFKELDSKEKPVAGLEINKLKKKIEAFFEDSNNTKSKNSKVEFLNIDYGLNEDPFYIGSTHPISNIINDISLIFQNIGFSSFYGKEVDTDYYNFEALNIPPHHPARDMQDTFYIDKNNLLRTHTSSSQIHFMEENSPPIRIIVPGRVYRNEDISVRSYCLFNQIEGLYVDKGVSFSDLKGTLIYFVKQLFGKDIKIRFRPSYFPFTEPSAEMDVYWGLETESDYRITKGTGWLEILGCGMVNPKVFEHVNYDKNLTGFAFGLGIERMAMLKYNIEDIRDFYQGDIRFLRQFR